MRLKCLGLLWRQSDIVFESAYLNFVPKKNAKNCISVEVNYDMKIFSDLNLVLKISNPTLWSEFILPNFSFIYVNVK